METEARRPTWRGAWRARENEEREKEREGRKREGGREGRAGSRCEGNRALGRELASPPSPSTSPILLRMFFVGWSDRHEDRTYMREREMLQLVKRGKHLEGTKREETFASSSVSLLPSHLELSSSKKTPENLRNYLRSSLLTVPELLVSSQQRLLSLLMFFLIPLRRVDHVRPRVIHGLFKATKRSAQVRYIGAENSKVSPSWQGAQDRSGSAG